MAEQRAARVAINEMSFREVNDRLAADLRPLTSERDELLTFVCECGRRGCKEGVRVSLAEYESVRADELTFVILPGHELDDVESVVDQTDRYAVVRKSEEARPVVDRGHP